MNDFSLTVARRYFSTRRKSGVISLTSVITVTGVFLGTVAILISLSVLNGFQKVVFDRALDMEADLRIDMRHLDGEERERLQRSADSLAGALNILPMMERKLILHRNGENRGVFVRGILPDEYRKMTRIDDYLFYGDFLSDDLTQTDVPQIVLGSITANNYGIHTGDTLTVIDVTGMGSLLPPMVECVVSDIFQVDIFDYDVHYAFMHLDDMRYLTDEPGYDFLEIKGNGLSDSVEDYPVELRSRIRFWQDDHRELFAAMKIEKTGSFLVLNLIIILAAFNLIASLMLLLLEKRWEAGILKSMGMDRGQALRVYLYLGWINGGIGILAGLILALPLLLIQQTHPFIPLPSDVYFINWLPVLVRWQDVAVTVVTLSLIITLASLIPAVRVNRLSPLKAIHLKT